MCSSDLVVPLAAVVGLRTAHAAAARQLRTRWLQASRENAVEWHQAAAWLTSLDWQGVALGQRDAVLAAD